MENKFISADPIAIKLAIKKEESVVVSETILEPQLSIDFIQGCLEANINPVDKINSMIKNVIKYKDFKINE